MRISIAIFVLLISTHINAQQKIENVIIITTDGMRWQEVFTGMDPEIASNAKYNQGDSNYIFKTYYDADPIKRRLKLMPFLWTEIAAKGQIYGNRKFENKVNTANPYWFSYPGYNEIMTGFPDTAVNSNDYKANPHVTVLEYLNGQPDYKGRVAAFGAWDAFDRILNEQRAGFQVVSAFDTVKGKITERQKLINTMVRNSQRPFGDVECLDVFTHYGATEFMSASKPKVLYISYGETDEWAHHGYYKNYLDAARQVDKWIGEIWSSVQADPQYKNKTALLITVDHGRGNRNKEQWTDHGEGIEEASEIWFAVIAPGNVPAAGEIKQPIQLYQKQLAQTVAMILGKKYTASHPIGEAVREIWLQK
jgi:hypothetical protein